MFISLQGKTAVVCGSTQGMGLAIARQFAASGALCILMARNEARLQEVVNNLPTPNEQRHQYKVADFSQPDQVVNAIREIVTNNTIHILVNNTGGPGAGLITDAVATDFENAFHQHIINNHHLVQAVLPGMKAAQYGRIINIVSTSIRVPIPNLGVSNTIRAAVGGWAKTLSNEVAPYQITVNNIMPGLIKTQRLEAVTEMTMKQQNGTEEQAQHTLLQTIPMHRFGEPEEVAFLATFLASSAAAYITGSNIAVDGGRTVSI